MGDPRVLLDQANQLRRAGDLNGAATLLRNCLAQDPGIAAVWNMLGILQLEAGEFDSAVTSLKRAAEIDPAPPLFLNLARAQRASGDAEGGLESLNRALSIEPYFLPAILDKGEVLLALGQEAEALELYRLLFEGLNPNEQFPPSIANQLAAARQLLDRAGNQQMEAFSKALEEVATEHEGADLRRVRAYAENRAGKRRVFQQKPTGSHFPYLPAIEFFDRSLFPWFDEFERHTDAIKQEMLSLWADDDERFRPYVAYGAGIPLNQWAELNHSLRWSAWFFWEDGIRNDENCARCPRTAAAIESSPILDIPRKSPTAMFSILQPHTSIPPHTGTSNTRTTVHLPLIVPPGCGFRVGAETREWREGEAWAFDDTIEHEAWNDSDQPRAILIIDTWNPLLTEAEREVVRRIG
jgi:aspartyl/asparaginyl beta-hydroxylase (cupin superfamily)